eukprot:gnl/TRDRNA2_/TRDRNA2_45255_c0_seq1.p1 gnl/TRDRNA2_/TRDRNA2_45255_c0~~gnl/TRDRNA2_/TRDRNA2_45255_c0_seq1.p1  ORF type:complete len:145 (+),score=19.23 gnl/TRDRNA2_/TRDRNA2_45255_c0_seq1:64-498(+)
MGQSEGKCTCLKPDKSAELAVVDPLTHESVTVKNVGLPLLATLVIGCESAEGESKTVTFTKRPLGLDFDMRAPIIISAITPGSYAEQLGVQAGWKIVSVNSKDVSNASFQDAYDSLQAGFRQLPEAIKMTDAPAVAELSRLAGS